MLSVEERLTKLEQVVFGDCTGEIRKKDWLRTIGMFDGDPRCDDGQPGTVSNNRFQRNVRYRRCRPDVDQFTEPFGNICPAH